MSKNKDGAGPAGRGKILALGELLVDLIPGRENMRLEDAGPVVKTASGSAGIFACAAALLGGCGGFIGKVGNDSLSRMVLRTLEEQGVDLSHVVHSDEGQVGLAFLEYLPEGRNYQYYRKNSVGSLLRADELDEAYIGEAYAVHFPGMLLELTPQMRAACERLWRSRGRRACSSRLIRTSGRSFPRMNPRGNACCGRCGTRISSRPRWPRDG